MARRTAEEYITVPEFLRQLEGKLSKNLVYEQIGAGNIPSIRIGRRILIPSDALDQILTAQSGRTGRYIPIYPARHQRTTAQAEEEGTDA
jgi:excisionase family DNA binding protein